MHRHSWLLATVAAVALAAPASAAEPQQVWEAGGFKGPESALYDADADVIYVSNVNGEPAGKDGNGFISKLSPEGEITELEWVTGLDAPKGLALADGKLYVSNIDELVEIDVASGKIAQRYPAEGAKFLNDVTADDEGRVYVAGMMTNTIWVLEDGKLSKMIEDEALDNPNGLLAQDGKIVVGSWGKMNPDFSTDVAGHLKVVDPSTKKVEPLGKTDPIGNLDGVEPDGKGGYYVTDWLNGGLFHIAADGSATKLLPLKAGSADLGMIPEKKLLLVPMTMDNAVLAFKVD